MKNLRIALFIHRIGPYHHARFDHAGRTTDLHVVETRPGSEEYPWKMKDGRWKIEVGRLKMEDGSWNLKSQANRKSQINYHPYNLDVTPNPEKGWRGRILKRKINDILHTINPDVIVTTGWADPEYQAALLWARSRKIPCVIISDSTYDDVPRNFLFERLKKSIVSEYSAGLAAGSRSKKYLQLLGMHEDMIFTAWDVVDNDYFYSGSVVQNNEKTLSEKYTLPGNYILCVARFIEKKNISNLVKAFQIIDQQGINNGCQMVIAGSGELKDKIQAEITHYGLNKSIHLFDFIQYYELPWFYGNASGFILPSLSDQWGLVVNEAMACGLPVIVSKSCGCSDDIVAEGVNGYIFDPDDSESLTNVLTKFFSLTAAEKNKMGLNSLQIISNWNLDAFSNGLKSSALSSLKSAQRSLRLLNRFILNFLLYLY